MNHKSIYDNLIKKAWYSQPTASHEKRVHWHKILPSSMGGKKTPNNMVKLSTKEAYISALLLIKIYPENKDRVMAVLRAFRSMTAVGVAKHCPPKWIYKYATGYKAGSQLPDEAIKRLKEKRFSFLKNRDDWIALHEYTGDKRAVTRAMMERGEFAFKTCRAVVKIKEDKDKDFVLPERKCSISCYDVFGGESLESIAERLLVAQNTITTLQAAISIMLSNSIIMLNKNKEKIEEG